MRHVKHLNSFSPEYATYHAGFLFLKSSGHLLVSSEHVFSRFTSRRHSCRLYFIARQRFQICEMAHKGSWGWGSDDFNAKLINFNIFQ